jgi:sialate O-acetylesterase
MRFSRLVSVALLVTFCAVTSASQAAIKLPSVIGSNMVLQQDRVAPIWGWADKGETVTVAIAGQTQSTTAKNDGGWELKLDKLEATSDEKPLEMIISGSEGDRLVLKNILVGEVWVCSGQSNMEMGVGGSNNGAAEIKAADYPGIRLFTVPKVMTSEPIHDVTSRWLECKPKNMGSASYVGFSAAAYFFGRELHKKLKVPIGLIHTSWGGTPADYWISRKALEAEPSLKPLAGIGENSKLYNGMIAPLVPFAIRGAIWYQGESNVGRAAQYRVLLPAMIRNWRADWGEGDFPFGIVQIAPYDYQGLANWMHNPALAGLPEAELWESQLNTVATVPNTGIALTMDIGELKNIHPKNKQEVGRRLALWALATVYGQQLEFSGPIYKSMQVDGDKIRISFDHVAGGLKSRDGKPLNEFTIAGTDGKFQPATAEIDGSVVIVHADGVPKPVAVRFAFHDTAQPNLENEAGLPAAPFRTDAGKQ